MGLLIKKRNVGDWGENQRNFQSSKKKKNEGRVKERKIPEFIFNYIYFNLLTIFHTFPRAILNTSKAF